MKKILLILIIFTFAFSNYVDVQVASFSYTIGGVYGSCVKFKKNQYDSFADYNVCSCPSAANNSTYPNCYELYYNPQTKTVKYNYSEGGQYNYWTASNDYTCHNYTEETQILECSEMNQLQCNQEGECEWLVNIEYGDCSDYNNGTTCDANENCFWDLCYGGSYGSWSHCCRGGDYQIVNSYCEEIYEILGDINGDGILNVGDIVLIVGLILNSGYDNYADMNQDGILNVIDVIDLINTILNK